MATVEKFTDEPNVIHCRIQLKVTGTDSISGFQNGSVVTVAAGASAAITGAGTSVVLTADTVNDGSVRFDNVGEQAGTGYTLDFSAATGTHGFVIFSYGGNDTIIGSSKADDLYSSGGTTSLTSGTGNDRLFISNGSHATITDLSIGDYFSTSVNSTAVAIDIVDYQSANSVNARSMTLKTAVSGGRIDMSVSGYIIDGPDPDRGRRDCVCLSRDGVYGK